MLFVALFVIQQPKVSLEIRGERLAVCAPKIAQALGMERLEIKPPFQEEVGAIRVTNVDRETFKQKIEQAFRGTFIQKEQEWTFEQTPEQKQQERREHFDMLATEQSKFMDGAKKVVAAYKPFDEKIANEVAKRYKNDKESDGPSSWEKSRNWHDPLGRFVVTLISRLKPQHWQQVNDHNSRIVYSRFPNQMQKALPVPTEDLVSTFLQNQRIYARALIGQGVDPEMRGNSNGWEKELKLLGPSDLVNLVIVVTQDSFALKAYSEAGQLSINVEIHLSEFKPPRPHVDLKYPPESLSPISADYDRERLGGGIYFSRERPFEIPFSPHLRRLFLVPEQVDPLSFVTPDTLFTMNPKLNVVANLYQDLFPSYVFEEFFKAYKNFYPHVTFSPDWLMVKLPNPYIERSKTINRARMGSILRSVVNGPFPTLEEQSEMPELRQEENVLREFLDHLTRGTALRGLEYDTFLTLYGSLSPQERQAARLRPWPLGSLNQGFLSELHNCVFGIQGLSPQVNTSKLGNKNDEDYYDRLDAVESGLDSLGREPTFLHPFGLQPTMTLRITESQSSELVITRKSVAKPGPAELIETAESLARSKFYSDLKKKDDKWTLDNYDLKAIKVRGSRRVTLVIDTMDGYCYEVSGTQPLAFHQTTYGLDALPNDLLEEFEKSYLETKRAYEEHKRQEENPPPTLSK